MPDEFDPYTQWLKIPPEDCPPDHYALLGLPRFESDQSRIARAADDRMGQIRRYQTGPRGVYTQPILNELSNARICLLDPATKGAYDQMLQGMLMAAEAPAVPAEAPVAAQPAPPEAVVEPWWQAVVRDPELPRATKRSARRRAGARRKRRRLVAWFWTLAAAVALAALGLFLGLQAGRQSAPDREEAASAELDQPSDWLARNTVAVEAVQPVTIYQESNGSIHFPAMVAEAHGPTLRRAAAGDVDVLTDWESMDDWASWQFKVLQLPPNGVFEVQVTYAAHPESNGGKFTISVGENSCECTVRGTGEPVTETMFLAIPLSGAHQLEVRPKSKPARRLMTLKSIMLAFPS